MSIIGEMNPIVSTTLPLSRKVHMVRYETLFLTVPEITTDESNTLEKQFEKMVSQAKGTVLSYERWGKFRLAYPIRRYDYGVYYLMRFEVDNDRKDDLLKGFKTLFGVKLVDLIMRNIIVRLNPTGSLDYKRPESLEEVPTKDIDTFVKESKSLLAHAPTSAPVQSAPASAPVQSVPPSAPAQNESTSAVAQDESTSEAVQSGPPSEAVQEETADHTTADDTQDKE